MSSSSSCDRSGTTALATLSCPSAPLTLIANSTGQRHSLTATMPSEPPAVRGSTTMRGDAGSAFVRTDSAAWPAAGGRSVYTQLPRSSL